MDIIGYYGIMDIFGRDGGYYWTSNQYDSFFIVDDAIFFWQGGKKAGHACIR